MAARQRWTRAASEVLGMPVSEAIPLARRRPGASMLMVLGFLFFALVVFAFTFGLVPGPRLLAYAIGAAGMAVLLQLGQEPVFAALTPHGIQMTSSSRWAPSPTAPPLGPLDPTTVDGPGGLFRNVFVVNGVTHRTPATQSRRMKQMLDQASR